MRSGSFYVTARRSTSAERREKKEEGKGGACGAKGAVANIVYYDFNQ